MSKRNYKIYIHKNKINGKVYIGQTYTSLKQRFGNGKYYSGCPIFYNAIQKYGWDNFEHLLLEENIYNQEIANEREKYYIKKYKSTNSKYGYNIQKGGSEQTALSIKVYQYDLTGNFIKEYNSIADAMRDNNISNGKISDCCKHKRNSAGGYMWSYNKKEKIRPYKKKTNSKPVYQYDLNGNFIMKFSSVVEAGNILNFNRNNIVSCCNNNQTTAYGFQWSYEYKSQIKPIENATKNQSHDTTILQLDENGELIAEYTNAIEASKQFNESRKAYKAITQCLLHSAKMSYGYIWIYKTEKEYFDINNYIQYQNSMKSIEQYDKNMNYITTFNSITDAARNVGGATGNICRCIQGKYKTAYGYIWRYAS